MFVHASLVQEGLGALRDTREVAGLLQRAVLAAHAEVSTQQRTARAQNLSSNRSSDRGLFVGAGGARLSGRRVSGRHRVSGRRCAAAVRRRAFCGLRGGGGQRARVSLSQLRRRHRAHRRLAGRRSQSQRHLRPSWSLRRQWRSRFAQFAAILLRVSRGRLVVAGESPSLSLLLLLLLFISTGDGLGGA